MFSAAARVLSGFSPALADPDGPLFPPLEIVREISYRVALAVGAEAIQSGLAQNMSTEALEEAVKTNMWSPRYLPLKHPR
jgi:malate dehydrogenase (oxaloacetate-decarboxylating)